MKQHLALVRKDSKYWVVFLLIGFLFMITGGYSLLYPFAKNISIARIMGLLALLIGTVKIVLSIRKKAGIACWKRHVAIGISNVLIGIFMVSYQGFSMLVLPFLLSFWILSGGIAMIEETTDINFFRTSDTDWMLAGGILTVVCFFIAAYIPFLGAITAILAAAVFLFVTGLFYVFLALRLRIIKKEFRDTAMHLANRA